MKHGDKNAKKGKAVSQASGKKAGGEVETTKSGKGGKAVQAGKETGKASEISKKQQAGPKESGSKASPQAGGKGSPKESVAVRPTGKADPRGRAVVGEDGFTNPVVGNAFKRAIKKYPNAFRRLTD